jgi:hypothetical protein
MMKEAATIKFIELDTSSEALAIVRYDQASVAVCLSVQSNGDVEVVMRKEDARALLEALRTAIGS